MSITFHDPTRCKPELYQERLKMLSAVKRQKVACPVCDSHVSYDVLGTKLGFQVVRCSRCRHVYVNPQLDPEAVALIYDHSYWDELQPSVGSPSLQERLAFDYQNALAKLQRDILPWKTNGRFLDVGCSNGALVKRAMEIGFEAVGLEVSDDVADVGRKVFGVDVRAGTVLTVGLPQASFDVVTMYDVVEHMFSPRADLNGVHGLLRPGGIVVIETVNTDSLNFQEYGLDWTYVMPVEHVHYFSEANLIKVLEGIGFNVVESKCPHEDNVVVIARKA